MLPNVPPSPTVSSDSDSTLVDSDSNPTQPPLNISLEPEGHLLALVWTHDIPSTPAPLPCWTYVSHGLAAVGQTEIVFTLLRDPAAARDAFPPAPLRWFELLYTLARSGQTANTEYARTQFTASDFLGRADFAMVVYTRPQPLGSLPPVALPARNEYLQAVVLTAPEAAVAARYGVLRALAHLGRAARYFPYPPWIDTARASAVGPDDLDTSVLGGCPAVPLSGAQAAKEGADVTLYLLPRAAQSLPEALDALAQAQPATPFALLLDLCYGADSCLVWKNGQDRPSAIGGTTSDRTSLCFLVVCPAQAQTSLKMVEDGYVLFLTDADWETTRAALVTCAPLAVPTSMGPTFHVEPVRDTFFNPVDGQTYAAPDGSVWRTYRPQGPAAARPRTTAHPHLALERVVLLTQPAPGTCDVPALTAYMGVVQARLAACVPQTAPDGAGRAGVVQIDLVEGAVAEVVIRVTPAVDGLDVPALQAAVRDVPAPAGVPSIRFQLVLGLWGGMPDAGTRGEGVAA